jgi:hypothetical protein
MVVMLWIVVFVVKSTFHTIPTVESYGVGVFVPARTLIAVKLLTPNLERDDRQNVVTWRLRLFY